MGQKKGKKTGVVSIIFSMVLILCVSCGTPGLETAVIKQVTAVETSSPIVSTPTTSPTLTATAIPQPLPPVLIEAHPYPGSEIALRQTIEFAFSEAMEAASVESAFKIEPSVPGKLSWENDHLLMFSPDQEYPQQTTVNITIKDTAQAQNGLKLSEPISLQFTTPGDFRIIEQIPAPDSEDINPSDPIMVTFNQPVVPLSGDMQNLQPAFTLQPTVEGNGEWRNTSTYIFYPDPPLSGGKKYSIQFSSDLTSLQDVPLDLNEDQIQWTFNTSTPEVLNSTPETGSNILLDESYTITFNQAMDPTSVEEKFIFQDSNGAKIPGQFSWDETYTEFTFSPNILLPRSSTFFLILPGSALAQGGTELGQDFQAYFRTIGALTVESTNPSTEEMINADIGFSSISIQLNAPLGEQDLKSLISLTPEISNLSLSLDITDQKQIYLSGNFTPSSEYQLRIDSQLKDKWGDPMGRTLTFDFKTGPASPSFTIPMLLTGTPVLFLTPQDKAISAQAVNLSRINLTTASLSFPSFISLAVQGYFNDVVIQPSEKNEWEQTLNLRPNKRENISVNLNPDNSNLLPGLYYFKAEPISFSEEALSYPATFLTVVSNVHMTIKKSSKQVTIWSVDLETFSPIANQSITLFDKDGNLLGSGITDPEGICRIDIPQLENNYEMIFAVSGQPGNADFGLASSDWNRKIAPWNFGLDSSYSSKSSFAYLYTDRPIYRPGQTLYFRAVPRAYTNGRYSIPDFSKVTIELTGEYSYLTQSFPVISSQTLPLSNYGTTSGSIQLPDNAPTGTYTLSVKGIEGASIYLRVEEYQRPEIELLVDFASPEIQASNDLEATIQANYYFGSPFSEQEINWSIYGEAQQIFLPNGYLIGKDYAFWESSFRWPGFRDPTLGEYITSGTGKTDENGELKLNIPVQNLASIDLDVTQTLTIEATIQEEGRAPISARGRITVHPSDFYIGIRPDNWIGQANTPSEYSIQTYNWQKEPSGEHLLRAEFSSISLENTNQYSPIGMLEQKVSYELISSTDFSADNLGKARLAFTPPQPGLYELKVYGEGALSRLFLWVGGENFYTWPSLPDQQLELKSDSDSYQPGDSASIFIANPFQGKSIALITVERDRVMQSFVQEINQASEEISIPLSEEDAPNVYVSVSLLGKAESGKLDFRQGYKELKVAPDALLLQVNLTPNVDQGQPGEKVNFTVQVRDANGNPVQGEFSLAIVDKATLALADPASAPINDAFYGPQPLGVMTSIPLSAYAFRLTEVPLGLGGGGGAGAFTKPIRKEFPDTAYWNGTIETNRDGNAEIQITLPDNLTTWVADLRGITKDSLVGQATQELVVSKPLMIRPAVPRFLVEGDHFQLSATVHNNTSDPLDITASIIATGIKFDATTPNAQPITLTPNSQQTINWWATVENVDEVKLIFEAQSGELQDAAQPTQGNLPVLRYRSPQTFGTSGILSNSGERLEIIALPQSYQPSSGSLQVETTTSMVGNIIQDIQPANKLSMDFTEGILSHLLANLSSLQIINQLDAENIRSSSKITQIVKDDLSLLISMQNQDGGWGWWANTTSDTRITAFALFCFTLADENNILYNKVPFQNALQFLSSSISYPTSGMNSGELDQLIFQYYVLQKNNPGSIEPQAFIGFQDSLSPWSQALLASMLAASSTTKPDSDQILQNLKGSVNLSATGAHWEAADTFWQYPGSPIYNTAWVVYILSDLDPSSPLIMDAVQYLVKNYRYDDGWSLSYDSAWSRIALSNALKTSGDLDASFSFKALLNDSLILEKDAGSSSGLASTTAEIPLEKLFQDNANSLRIQRSEGTGNLYYRAFLQLYQPVTNAPAVESGIFIQRSYYPDTSSCRRGECSPIDEASISSLQQPLLVRVSITLPETMYNLIIEDNIPAGAEILNPALKTAQLGRGPDSNEAQSYDYFENFWGWWYFTSGEVYDNSIQWTAKYAPAGTYELTYRMQPVTVGEFNVIPAHAYLYYFPDVEGRSAGMMFSIKP